MSIPLTQLYADSRPQHDDEADSLLSKDENAQDSNDTLKLKKQSRWQYKLITSDKKHTFVPALEGLRGLAVLATQISHAGNLSSFCVNLGPMGLDIFFILSGFLITGVLIRHQGNTGKISYKFLSQFYTDRALRLYPPLLLLVFVFGSILLYQGAKIGWLAWYSFLSLAYLSNMPSLRIKGDWGPFGNTWSLAVEEHFYVFWSTLLPIVYHLSPRFRLSIMITLIFISFTIRTATNMYPGTFFGIEYYYGSLPNFWKMLLGATLQLVPMPVILSKRIFAHIGLLGLISIMLFIKYGPQPDYASMIPGWGAEGGKGGVQFWASPMTCLYTLMVIISIHGDTEESSFFWLENKVVRFMGRISYAWYLWQIPILKYVNAYQTNTASSWGNTSSAFVMAMISTFLLERPLDAAYKAWRDRRKDVDLS